MHVQGKHSALFSVLQEELGVLQTQIFQLDSKRQRAVQDGDPSKHRER